MATYKVADNRLTADVTDMVISEDYLYVLQKSSLARFSLDGTEHLTVSFPKDFSLIDFEPLHFSVIKDKIMLSNGKKLKAFTLSDSENALSATENTINVVGTWEENNICVLYAFDEEFYLLKNRTINNVQYAVIYKMNQTPSQYEIDAEGFIYKKEGTGISFTINSFGELYLLATEGVSGKKITCFDIINKEEALITTPLGEGVKKIISDFENVYVLDESTIYSVYENEYYKIEKSANFNQLDNPVSFTADLTSGKTYFLYGGYILQSDSLPLKTPNAYTVPEDYTAFEQNPQTATVSSGAKLFTVTADGNFFKYNSIISAGEGEYLLICELSEDFCIIGFEEYSYLARKQDLTLTEISTFTPEFIQGYYVTKAGKYAQPMLNLTYKIADVVAYEKVTVISGVTVNQIPFYEVKFEDETKGYIQKSFIVEFISEESIRENFYLAKCSKTDIYAEDGTTVIGKMDAGAVKVYGKENELYKITFKDGFGYIKSDAIIQKENKTFKYTLAIMLVATSFTISAIYLLIRRNRKNSI